MDIAIIGIDQPITIKGNDLIVKRTQRGCNECFFQNGKGARYCKLTWLCFAHMRPDRQSVIFSKRKSKNNHETTP
jgi:hypothetical protein